MKFSYVSALVFYGVMWLLIGLFLGAKSVQYGLHGLDFSDQQIQNRLFMLLLTGMLVGLVKGRFVLSKVVDRVVRQIVEFEEPILLKQLMSRRYLFLILGMMSLGMVMKVLPISFALKAIIDAAVSTALLYGSMLYFRKAYQFHLELPE
jgi:hypothetical protein